MSSTPFTGVKAVLLDIDDTLWENNIFFLRSLDWFCTAARRHGHTHKAAQNILNQVETLNIMRIGYGYDSYEASLLQAIRKLMARSGEREEHAKLKAEALRWGKFLRTHPIEWLPTVAETLPELCKRFPTIVVTKGHFGDQMSKVDRCGMKHLFHGVEVVPHKYPANYRGVLQKYGLSAESTVMVGNSPKSDINMPKRAGLRTIYVPHPQTWHVEMEPIMPEAPLTIEVGRFAEVLDNLRA